MASTDNVAVSGYRIFHDGVLAGTSTGASYTDASTSPHRPPTATPWPRSTPRATRRRAAHRSLSPRAPPIRWPPAHRASPSHRRLPRAR
ncbi:hypothetical protein LP420_14745 [Massilia sp. B-10]|nr:hypothetical protein LP420_14745 [Massilia sp. B-10]